MSLKGNSDHYHAVVDMGSNGIRCSISDLSPLTSRILPTIYQERYGISLYEAQYQNRIKVPIPEAIIEEILILLANFKKTCIDFGVPIQNIRLVATEATRTAVNSQAFLSKIREKTGFEIRLLSQEEESKYGALGIASSVNRDAFEGLILDMGGGSIQLTWMQKSAAGHIALTCRKSLPYGAAALKAQLATQSVEGSAKSLEDSVLKDLRIYFEDLRSAQPESWKNAAQKGLQIFASGGGFRSWGHILISLDPVQPYPIPIVNGFVVDGSHLVPDLSKYEPTEQTHRISSRRGSQVPAIQCLVSSLVKALGDMTISTMTFCQGGVREGLLFDDLPEDVRSQNGLTAASSSFAPKSSSALMAIFSSSLPESGQHRELIPGLVNMLYYHGSHPKDIVTAAALRSTTTGILASIHGISHYDRAILALVICERWGGKDDLPLIDKDFHGKLETLKGPAAVWWARYMGCIARGLGEIYPAGVIHETLVNISVDSTAPGVKIRICPLKANVVSITQDWASRLRKLGKRKNWAGAPAARYGMEVDVDVDVRDVASG